MISIGNSKVFSYLYITPNYIVWVLHSRAQFVLSCMSNILLELVDTNYKNLWQFVCYFFFFINGHPFRIPSYHLLRILFGVSQNIRIVWIHLELVCQNKTSAARVSSFLINFFQYNIL